MLRKPRKRRAIGDLDRSASHSQPAAPGEFIELPADDLACATELVGEILVRCDHLQLRSGEREQLLRQPHIDPLERDLLDDAKQIRDPAAERRNSRELAISLSNSARGIATARIRVSAMPSA